MLTRKLFNALTNPCPFKEVGQLLTNQVDVQNHLSEYFLDALNQLIPYEPLLVPDVPPFTLDIYSGPILFQEVVIAMQLLKNGKASGSDGVPPELLKYGKKALAGPLFKLLRTVWDDEAVPFDWNKGIIVKIFKKGQKTS